MLLSCIPMKAALILPYILLLSLSAGAQIHLPAPISDSEAHARYPDASLSMRGKMDAQTYYHGYRTPKTWTALTTAFYTPLWGVIVAGSCASTPPAEHNLMYPDTRLMRNSEYQRAYVDEAYRIKRREVWNGFAIGSIPIVVEVGLIYMLAHNYHAR